MRQPPAFVRLGNIHHTVITLAIIVLVGVIVWHGKSYEILIPIKRDVDPEVKLAQVQAVKEALEAAQKEMARLQADNRALSSENARSQLHALRISKENEINLLTLKHRQDLMKLKEAHTRELEFQRERIQREHKQESSQQTSDRITALETQVSSLLREREQLASTNTLLKKELDACTARRIDEITNQIPE